MGFSACHPAINFIYFACAVSSALLLRHPVYLAISLLCAWLYAIRLRRRHGAVLGLVLLPCILAFALRYASYHHFGVTVLRQNFVDNNITLESLVCGLALGTAIAAAMLWLSCVHAILTADKVVYLFGRVSPHLSLFLAILLRMVPRIGRQAKKINTARCGIGLGAGQGNLGQRLRNVLREFSMLITWTIEMLTGASESMRSRGSNLRGRTAFSIYRFDNRDRAYVIALFASMIVLGMGVLLRQCYIRYAPAIVMAHVTPASYLFWLGYAAFCLMPLMLDLYTDRCFERARKTGIRN